MQHKIIVNNLAVKYSDEGKGPVVVLLHGWGSNLEAFNGLAFVLAVNFRVIRLDCPGFGGSEQPAQDWYISDYAAWLQRALAKLHVNEVYALIGHSFGGRVVIKAVATQLVQPAKIVLLDSGGVRASQTLRNQLLKAVAKIGRAITALPGLQRVQATLRKRLYHSIGSTDYLNSGPMKQIFLHTINEDLQAEAAQIDTPTLILWGQNDDVTPLKHGRLLATAMQHSKLQVVPDAGHFVFIDQPQAVDNAVSEFLQ